MAQPPIEENPYYIEMMEQLEQAKADKQDMSNALHGHMSVFGGAEQQDNLIRWQLDLKEDLDRIYHLLRGDSIGHDENGELSYMPQEDPELVPFNEFGVQTIMNIMAFYLNRNTILSNYEEKMIEWKVFDFGNNVSDLIFNKYEDMMTTIDKKDYDSLEDYKVAIEAHLKEKIKYYPMIVAELVDTVHSAYLRAYRGGERESLRTARTVTQNEPLYNRQPNQQYSPPPPQNKPRWLNPGSW